MTGGTADSGDTADSDTTADAGPDLSDFPRLAAQRTLRVGPNAIVMGSGPVLAGRVTRRSTTNDEYMIDIGPFVTRYWEAAKYFPDGCIVRPLAKQDGGLRGSTGCDHQIEAAGMTAEKEPKWPSIIGNSVADGAAVSWLAIPTSVGALDRVITDSTQLTWDTDDDSLEVSAGAFKNTDGELKFTVWIANGTDQNVSTAVAHVVFDDESTQDFGIEVVTDDTWLDA